MTASTGGMVPNTGKHRRKRPKGVSAKRKPSGNQTQPWTFAGFMMAFITAFITGGYSFGRRPGVSLAGSFRFKVLFVYSL